MGIGSAVFHPESSRVARMASGGQHGMAQSLFQVGGNAGSALVRSSRPSCSPRDNRVSRGFRFWLSLDCPARKHRRLDETSQIIFTKIRHGGSRASRCNAAEHAHAALPPAK